MVDRYNLSCENKPMMQQQPPLDYESKTTSSSWRRMGLLLIIDAVLCLAAFIAAFAIIVIDVGGG